MTKASLKLQIEGHQCWFIVWCEKQYVSLILKVFFSVYISEFIKICKSQILTIFWSPTQVIKKHQKELETLRKRHQKEKMAIQKSQCIAIDKICKVRWERLLYSTHIQSSDEERTRACGWCWDEVRRDGADGAVDWGDIVNNHHHHHHRHCKLVHDDNQFTNELAVQSLPICCTNVPTWKRDSVQSNARAVESSRGKVICS